MSPCPVSGGDGTTTTTITLFFLLITTSTSTTSTTDPYTPGPLNSTHIHISAVVTIDLQEELDVWVPTEPGTFGTVYFIDSFGGYTPGSLYQEFGHFLASHGFALVVPWSLSLPVNPVDKVPIFASVLAWAEEHLEEKLHEKGVDEGVHLDLDNLVLSGHSAGSHVLVEYLKGGCGKVKAQVFVSPVDGVDPLGLIPEFCINPGEYLNYGLPTMHIEGGFDSLPGSSGVACAPLELSNIRFYNAVDPKLAGKWHLNTTQFGHADLLDDEAIAFVESSSFCAWNPNLSLADHDAYRRFVGGSMVLFMNGHQLLR
ncbi:uncharacterized protein LOC126995275 [Eriocheir sinensis]|uniref:uncharacterized protein LOC126995275 n=1 Tax=Eriocheir sinensis TaxID=95602 RepID=UPI0021C72D88|nr:uncharacterized protein LOC126995275 [Eriocheir sinensis]